MSDFSAKIRAILDTKDVPRQLKNIEKNVVTLKHFKLDTSGLPSEIQASLDRHKFKISLDGIKMNNIDSQMKNTGEKAGQALVNRINQQISNGKIEASIAKITAQYEKLSTTGHSKLSNIKKDIQELTTLQNAMGSTRDNDTLIANYKQFNNTLSRVKNNLTTVSAESKTFVSSLQISTLDTKISDWMKKNTKASKNFIKVLENLRSRLSSLNGDDVIEFNSIEREFEKTTDKAKKAGQIGTSFFSQIKNSFKSLIKYVSASTVIYQSISAFKQMYQNVYDIDREMTELKKVTNETAESYSNFLKNAGFTSKEIGTTIKDLVSSTADFARLGFSFEDSQELAKVANVYAVVGDEIDSIDTATKSVISTMTAFHIEAGNAMSIVDKFNEVGNNFAISSGGIGEAMERSASSLYAANNTLDESIALITAANTVVQDPDSVGTAFKTKFYKNCLYVQKCA